MSKFKVGQEVYSRSRNQLGVVYNYFDDYISPKTSILFNGVPFTLPESDLMAVPQKSFNIGDVVQIGNSKGTVNSYTVVLDRNYKTLLPEAKWGVEVKVTTSMGYSKQKYPESQLRLISRAQVSGKNSTPSINIDQEQTSKTILLTNNKFLKVNQNG